MSEQPVPICQWCRLPVLGTPTWWDGQPQCADPIACADRVQKDTE